MPQDLNVALRIRADLQNSIRQLKRLEQEMGKTQVSGKRAAGGAAAAGTELRKAGAAGRQAASGNRRAAAEFERINLASRRAAGGVGLLRGAVAGIGFAFLVREALQLGRALTDTGLAYERFQQRFTFAGGDFRQGAADMQFVREEAERLGLAFSASAEGFTSLSAAARGTALEGRAAREIFTSIAEAATVLQLSAEQTNGALTAIEQIISKGKVSAEELRGQLGERLPGAFQIAARAMGVTTAELDEMLVAGELLADDFLPRFAAEVRRTFEGDLPTAVDSAAARFNRLGNEIEDLKDSVARSGLIEFLADVADRVRGIIRQLREADADSSGVRARLAAEGRQGGRAPVSPRDARPSVTGVDFGAIRAERDEFRRLREELEADIETRPRQGGRAVDPRIADLAELKRSEEELTAILERQSDVVHDLADETARAYERAIGSGPLRIDVPPPDAEAIKKFIDETEQLQERQRQDQLRSVGDTVSLVERQFTLLINERREHYRKAIEAANGNALEERRIIEAQSLFERAAEKAKFAAIRKIRDDAAEKRQREEKRAADRAEREAERAEREAEREARAAERASKRQGDAARQVLQAVQNVNAELSGSTAYDRAVVSAERWREANLRSLREVGLAHGALAEAVEDAFARMVAAAEEQSTVLGGVRGALRDYAREAAESGREARGAMERALRGMEDALTSFVSTGKLEFGDLVNSIVADLARLAIRSQITGPLFGALGGALGLPVGVAHSGGVAGSLARQRTVDPRVFAFAPRYHEGGIAGLRPDEVPAILQRGETVLPRGASMPAFAPRIAIEFVNQGTPQREVSRDVRFDPEAMVVQIVVDNVENGGPIRNAVRRAATPGAI